MIDRLRSKYAFEDKIFSGGGSGQGGQGHPEENRTERYASPENGPRGIYHQKLGLRVIYHQGGRTWICFFAFSFPRWQRDHFSGGDDDAQEVEKCVFLETRGPLLYSI